MFDVITQHILSYVLAKHVFDKADDRRKDKRNDAQSHENLFPTTEQIF